MRSDQRIILAQSVGYVKQAAGNLQPENTQ